MRGRHPLQKGKPFIMACAAFLAGAVVCGAQIAVEDSVVTDSIDIFAAKETTKPGALARLSSIVLPGLGHELIGRADRAAIFFALEASCIAGMAWSERSSRVLFDNARTVAAAHAGVRSNEGGDNFWHTIGLYQDADEYNRYLEYNRTADISRHKFVADSVQWRWDDASSRKEYNNLRTAADRFHLAATFFIAAMVVDRVAAFLDTRALTRDTGLRGASLDMRIVPFVAARGNPGLALAVNF
jgi:hypothetical protein